ncbi:type II toxin-antitoxin system VapC family toxin [Plectonema cf. radiosum LEGE 06105]|uniref:Type II toxin-antitoxin system VapC family toxin n=1 Tax=Plectonema cf. radiosum LEGE 06105 TaxID=945769 RepID=A0A8J7FHS3_9CYAN|nr:type II toxin-antitoxin system VapC family toxin [Plectonema radiosum]MBE9213941.1 type II toxin-antitoxin system VapC family toxin [Plectonema cf. radiosum LEGE 06105]
MSDFSLIYLLDTNACIVYLKNKNSSINHHFNSIESNKIVVCSVVKAELFYGSSNPSKKSGFLDKYGVASDNLTKNPTSGTSFLQ